MAWYRVAFFSFWIWKFYTIEYKEEQKVPQSPKPVLYIICSSSFSVPFRKIWILHIYYCFLFNAWAEITGSTYFLKKERRGKRWRWNESVWSWHLTVGSFPKAIWKTIPKKVFVQKNIFKWKKRSSFSMP
jgi:hypothetical protein